MLFHRKCDHEYGLINKSEAPGYIRSFDESLKYFKCSKCGHCIAINEYDYKLKKMLTAY